MYKGNFKYYGTGNCKYVFIVRYVSVSLYRIYLVLEMSVPVLSDHIYR